MNRTLITFVTLAAAPLAMTTSANAIVALQESFLNTTGANIENTVENPTAVLDAYGWRIIASNPDAVANQQGISPGSAANPDGVPGIEDFGFVFLFNGIEGPQDFLSFTEVSLPGKLDKMSAFIRTTRETPAHHFALRIGSDWVVSELVTLGGQSDWNQKFEISVDDVMWAPLTVGSISRSAERQLEQASFSVGSFGSLPSGEVTAAGIFITDSEASGSSRRFDEFVLEIVPEPSVLSMVGLSSVALLLALRRRR